MNQSIIVQRLPQDIRANRESILEHWLQAVKQEPEIGSIPVPDSERSERLPELLDIATRIAEGNELTAEQRNAYLRHGASRYKQSYTIPLLMREARLLQACLADHIQRNFAVIEIIHLVPETVHFMATIDALWKAAARGFIQQANAEKVANRRHLKRVLDANTKAS
jgi:hypothetical protein